MRNNPANDSTPPAMTAEEARWTARNYKELAEGLARLGVPEDTVNVAARWSRYYEAQAAVLEYTGPKVN